MRGYESALRPMRMPRCASGMIVGSRTGSWRNMLRRFPALDERPVPTAFGVPRVPDVRGRVLCRSDHQSDWPDLPASSTCATGPTRSTDFLIRRRGRQGIEAELLTSRSRRASAGEEWGHSRRCAAASRDDRSRRSPGRARLENPPAA